MQSTLFKKIALPPDTRIFNYDSLLKQTPEGWLYKGKPFNGYMMQEERSAKVMFTADKKISGDFSGGWIFDAGKRTININGTICILADAWDWEATPRNVTLTYSGLTSAGISIWGKKVFY